MARIVTARWQAVKSASEGDPMYTSTNRPSYALWERVVQLFKSYKVTRGMIFGSIMMGALLAFELFNYTTTEFALCGMDFAGIARLFPPEKGRAGRMEAWSRLAGRSLAGMMNAAVTWWGVSI